MAESATALSHTLLTHPQGLHARPAVRIAQVAARFRAEIFIRVNDQGEWLSARSAAQVMRLQARANSVLCFRAEGEDAREAVVEMVSLVDRDFQDIPEGEWTVAAVIASSGLASGKLWQLPVPAATEQPPVGSPETEAARLKSAMDTAQDTLETLASSDDELVRRILALQLSLLRDEHFLQPARQNIATGMSAFEAWHALLEAEIAVYQAAGDEYLRARSLDLQDLQQRVAAQLLGTHSCAAFEATDILLATELFPSRLLALPAEHLRGIVLTHGSRISHVATLARHWGIPMLVEPRLDLAHLTPGTEVVVDAEAGQLIANPRANTLARYTKTLAIRAMESAVSEQFLGDPPCTAEGEAVRVFLDVDELTALDSLHPDHCDGIAWVRSEKLFGGVLPDEQTQYRRYRRLLDWLQGKPLGIALAATGEPDKIHAQQRALGRLATEGNLHVLLPGIWDPLGFKQAKGQFAQTLASLGNAKARLPTLGLLLSAPLAVLGLKRFQLPLACVDLDALLGYLLACPATTDAVELSHPVVQAVLKKLAQQSAAQCIDITVGGQVLMRPGALGVLLGCGFRSLVVAPGQLARLKAGLAEL